MNSRVGRLGGHSHDSRYLTFLFRSREATTHRVYLNEVDTPLRTILGATLICSVPFYRRLSKAVYQHPAGQPVRDAIEGRHLEMLRTEQARRDSDTPS